MENNGKQLRPIFDIEYQKCLEIQKEIDKIESEQTQKEISGVTSSLNAEKSKLAETNNKLKDVQNEISKKKQYLSSLGFFKKAEKVKTKEELQALYNNETELELDVMEIELNIENIKKKLGALNQGCSSNKGELSVELVKELVMFAIPHLGIVTVFTFLDRLGFDIDSDIQPISFTALSHAMEELVKERKLIKIIHLRKKYYVFPDDDFDIVYSDMEINL